LSLSLQASDLVQFFQNKIDTADFLWHHKNAVEEKKHHKNAVEEKKHHKNAVEEKKHHKKAVEEKSSKQLLRGIGQTELQVFRDSYNRIMQRLKAIIPQIQAIRTNFEARITAQNGIKQQKLTEQLTWLSRIGVAVLPLNAVAGLFGMNVPVPWQGNTFRMCMFIVYATLICKQIWILCRLFFICLGDLFCCLC
jgi:sorbitol-specific phosphotransferase system component IIBC